MAPKDDKDKGFSWTFTAPQSLFDKLDVRKRRTFFPLITENNLVGKLNAASSLSEIGRIAKERNLCDVCDMSGLDIAAAKVIVKCVAHMMYCYPKLRGRFCYVGSYSRYVERLRRLAESDEEVIREFGLQYVWQSEGAGFLGMIARDIGKSTGKGGTLASAIYTAGFADALIFDESDYGPAGYHDACKNWEYNLKTGYHPRNCGHATGVVYHEIGHMIDTICSLSANPAILALWRGRGEDRIAAELSRYATVSVSEFIAEAFSEYMSAPYPRLLAHEVAKIIKEAYSKIK